MFSSFEGEKGFSHEAREITHLVASICPYDSSIVKSFSGPVRLTTSVSYTAIVCSTPFLHLLGKILSESKLLEDILLFSSFEGE